MLVAFGVVLIAGCGEGHMNTKGRIMKGGAAFTVPEDDFVRVTFIPVMENGQNPVTCYIAEYNNKEGTFKVLGPDLTGIPRGKYRITVAHERKKTDLFKGAYDIGKTPFVFEIASNTQDIVIDLDNPSS
jgi:hypothetical protein